MGQVFVIWDKKERSKCFKNGRKSHLKGFVLKFQVGKFSFLQHAVKAARV